MSLLPSLEFVAAFFGYLFIPLHFIFQRALGRAVIAFLSSSEEYEQRKFSEEYLTGLLSYLITILLVKSIGCSWILATVFPYLFLLSGDIKRHFEGLFAWSYHFTLPHALWFATHFVIGMTLFDFLAGAISTPWKNAYGDLAYHLSMISSFALADNFPPQQVIFSGTPLSYPFFVNLWSSSLWFWESSYFFLSIIFLFQWSVLWEVVYDAVDGDEKPYLPWLILFAGGSYYALGENSGTLIPQGVSFTSFLTTIWIPQRSSLFGVAVSCTVLQLYFRWEEDKKNRLEDLKLAGFLLGLAPLVHTHICLMTGLFILILLIWQVVREIGGEGKTIYSLVQFLSLAALSLHALPFLLEKQSLLSLGFGGFFTAATSELEGFHIIIMRNLWTVFLLFGFTWVLSGAHRIFVTLIVLFLVVWCVQVSVWEWDQLKLFVPIYLVMLFMLGRVGHQLRYFLIPFAVVLVAPSIYEVAILLQKGERFEVFDRKKIEIAQELDEHLPRDAVLLVPTHHNTAAILTGRELYMSYVGWLWSHGIAYREREKHIGDLDTLLRCESERCPNYLVWTEDAKKFWKKRGAPPKERTEKITEALYRIKRVKSE